MYTLYTHMCIYNSIYVISGWTVLRRVLLVDIVCSIMRQQLQTINVHITQH